MKYNFDEQVDRQGTACEKYDGCERVFGTSDLLPLWVADMDFKIAPPIINAIEERLAHGILGYPKVLDSTYNAIISWLSRRSGWQVQRSWITFCPGVVPALSLSVQAFTKPGDKVVIQPPVYPPFFFSVTQNGREVVESCLLETDGCYTIDFNDLDVKLQGASLFILCNPHNPVGRAWTRDELMKLGELCIKHNVTVVADEIHADLYMPSHTHVSFASLSPEISDRTITFIAASKTFNIAGLTQGVGIASNKMILKKYNAESQRNFLLESALGLAALEAAFNHGEEWLEQLIDYISGNADYVASFMQHEFPKLKARKQEATYLMWIDCRGLGLPQSELVSFFVKEAKLGLNSGTNFGATGEGFMRLNLACPRATLEKAMNQLKEAYIKRF